MTRLFKTFEGDEANNPWTPLKDLSNVVECAVLKCEPGILPELEAALKKHKPAFMGLLKNPPRSSGDSALVKKASTEGIHLPPTTINASESEATKQRLPASVVEEALIISEMFGLNEISSLQLLLQAEEQLCQYPGLTRGLVAVLLYYDGRRSLVQALRTLIQGRSGVTWTLDTMEEVTEVINKYTQTLLEDGLVDKVLVLLRDLDWQREVMQLQQNLALGDAKHRRQVHDLFVDIRQSLADCLFAFAAQSGLPKNDVVRLIDYLSKVKPGDGNAAGTIDDVNLTLVMALLYAIDAGAVNKCTDGEETLQKLPLLSDPSFIACIHRELSHTSIQHRWDHPAIQSISQFAWSMTLSTLRSLPLSVQQDATYVDDDESVLDSALENGVFHWLTQCIFDNSAMQKEEFYMRRMHQLLTDLIVLMPLKVKELRNRADDAARNKLMHEQEGVQYTVPLAGQHFENLLNCITKLYKEDPMNLGLVLDYWCPAADMGQKNTERFPQRQVSLYKFVRLAGDLLMPSLYTPYVNVLVSLSGHPQAALHCFNLLKLNGLGNNNSSNSSTTVSWDHFFDSLHRYFANLRQEITNPCSGHGMDSVYSTGRQMTRGISPSEVYGLASVLKLISGVTKNSEAARIAVAEHASWQPGLVIVGLLSCPVPTVLKAELINTLSSLGRSKDVAHSIWHSIEAAQLINTTITMNNKPQGLLTELEDVETRNEEYPLTRSFLNLIDVLSDAGVPENLGLGTRMPPGFRPYLNFIRDKIYLKFNTRAYKNQAEKWEIGLLCLKIMAKLLQEYEPSALDFDAKRVKPSGFDIMTRLLQSSSETLRLILFILDEGTSLLDTYQNFPGKSELENCCLYALIILEKGLLLQPAMLEASRVANTNLLLTNLDQLLLGINPRSGQPDHMLNVVKFVTYSWWLPKHSLHAVKVLQYVAASATSQPSILATFRTNEMTALGIIKGFTEVLDNEEEDIEDARLAVVNLLQEGLSLPAPSLSHFLLGFNIQKGVSKSTIQPPGVLGAVRSPFHAILALLRPAEPQVANGTLKRSPQLSEASYKLIYTLAANIGTSEPTLRFLRSSEDFLSCQLALLPRMVLDNKESVCAIKSTSWLLKTVAIELKMLNSTRLRSQVSHLASLLLDASSSSSVVSSMDFEHEDQHCQDSSALTQLSRSVPRLSSTKVVSGQSVQHRLLAILEAMDFSDQEEGLMQESPGWQVFDGGQVNAVLKSCQIVSNKVAIIDVKAVHKVLNSEVAAALQQSSNAGSLGQQRQVIKDEIQAILLYAVKHNAVQEKMMTKRNLLDSWRQVTEILLCCIPLDILTPGSKQQLLMELLQILLNKVLDDDTYLELTNQVSGVVLLLLAALRQTFQRQVEEKERLMYSSALQVILKGLIMWIVGTSASSAQRVRANLYGGLLNYLRIGQDVDHIRKANLDVLASYGDGFLDVISRDSVSGHEIRRMLALSILDELVKLDGRGAWIFYLSKQGYLRHIVESLALEDHQLANLVSSRPDHLRAYYTYDSKMAMLTRLASTASGAEMLLEAGLMTKLAEMTVFSSRPEMPTDPVLMTSTNNSEDYEFIPSALTRYQQIVLPSLRLCLAILASLGSENRSAAGQVLHFVTAHECLIRVGLHYSGLLSLAGLQELSLLTGVIARSVSFEAAMGEFDSVGMELSGHLSRIQRQMLALVSHFGQSESLIRKMQTGSIISNKVKAVKLILEINANAMMYIRNIVAKNTKQFRVICAPSLLEAIGASDYNPDGGQHQSSLAANQGRSLSLGHAVLIVHHLCSHLMSAQATLHDLKEKLNSIHHLSSVELSSFAEMSNKLGSADQRAAAAAKMKQCISDKEQEIKLAGSATETSIFIIWKHLEHFMFYTTPGKSDLNSSDVLRSHQQPNTEAIERLKKDVRACFNENLFRKLENVEGLCGKNRSGFLAALIRRLKRLSMLN